MKTLQIVVQVSDEAARELEQRSSVSAQSEALLEVIDAFGLTLDPMHTGTDDPSLMSYFVVQAPDQVTAQRLIDRLQASEAVEAAFLQPPYGLP